MTAPGRATPTTTPIWRASATPVCASISGARAKATASSPTNTPRPNCPTAAMCIAWIAAQGWCDGQVAMIGLSWGGFNGLQIAARQPPALKTVIAVGFTDDRYATDIHWIGGCLSKDNFDWSSTMFASNDLPPDPAIVGERWREMWRQRIDANRPWILDWLPHQQRDAFWQRGSVCEDFTPIAVPVYAVSGWADNYSEAVPRLLAGLTAPCRGLVGPWAHSFPYKVAVEPAIGWLQEVVRWCDHWMKGCDTGIMDEPLYRVWMQEGVPPQTCYTERPGRWVGEDHWPSPRIEARRLPLGAGGILGGPGKGTATVCSPLWVGLNAGEIGRYGGDADWPGDQREDDGGSLVFLSEPLHRAPRNPRRAEGAPDLRQRQTPRAGSRAAERCLARWPLHPRDARPAEPDAPPRPRRGPGTGSRRDGRGGGRDGRHRPRLRGRAPHRRGPFDHLLARRLALSRPRHADRPVRGKLAGAAGAPRAARGRKLARLRPARGGARPRPTAISRSRKRPAASPATSCRAE